MSSRSFEVGEDGERDELDEVKIVLQHRDKIQRISEEIKRRKEILKDFILNKGIASFRDFAWAILYHPEAGYYVKGDIDLLVPYDDYEEKIDRSLRDAAIEAAIKDMFLMLETDNAKTDKIEIKRLGDEDKIKEGFEGVIIANEYFTSLPFNLVDSGKEVYVKWEGEFVEVLGEVSEDVKNFIEKLDISAKRFPVCLDAIKCMDKIASKIKKGYLLIIDYGLPAEEYYSRKLRLACFSKDGFGHNPYSCAGKRGVAAPVDFTALIETAENRGMDVTGFTSYRYFLLNTLGKDETSEPSDFKSIAMPVTLKVLILHKNIEWCRLKCLQNTPAFGYWVRYNRLESF